ncbi:fused MFS/spermidine synthase [Sorangium sp. So ce1389]|uniref:fused MFS/spermidine synthase n=1 Tax=Sorangium sp. So ce1389 TaxID=3133336 RepID=UPI003F620558
MFFFSGATALVYQIVWQRALFALYGLDITSVTMVVTAFMLGLGAGSALGGAISRARPGAALPVFGAAEIGIGIFGYLSLGLFDGVARITGGIGHLTTGLVAFLLLLLPTTLMGASLPLLVGYAVPRSKNVGRSVGTLYFVNTLGASAGAYMAVRTLLPALGLSGTVAASACLNVVLGAAVVVGTRLGDARRRGE